MTYNRRVADINWKPAKQRPTVSATGKDTTKRSTYKYRKATRRPSSLQEIESDYARPLRQDHSATNPALPAKLSAEYRSQRKKLPSWLLDQRLAQRGITIERLPNGRLPPLPVATRREIHLLDPYARSKTFSRNFLRFSDNIPWGTNHSWGERHTGICFDSPYQLDREFDWHLIAHADHCDDTDVANRSELPFWGKMNSGMGFVAFGDFDNPFFLFTDPSRAAWEAASIAARPKQTANRLKLLQTAFDRLPSKALNSDWVVSAQSAYTYNALLTAALPLSPETTHQVSRSRALHVSGRDFGGDVTLNIPLMVLCDSLPLELVMMCLTLRQYKEYCHVWKRLPEFPTFNRSWGDIVHHSDAPDYTRARNVIAQLTTPTSPDWSYSSDAPDSSNYR
jgi:hypothetical protein